VRLLPDKNDEKSSPILAGHNDLQKSGGVVVEKLGVPDGIRTRVIAVKVVLEFVTD
jgi:hypothetical protein